MVVDSNSHSTACLIAGIMATDYPAFVTPRVKALLRRKNKLMRKGLVEKAASITERLRKEIILANKNELSTLSITNSREMWESVTRITGREKTSSQISFLPDRRNK